jgi:DNA repair exonuclease SbcCD ATPase subunit
MNPEERVYQRLEDLERRSERYAALLDEHSRRLEALEGLPSALAAINQAIGRLEAKIESHKQLNNILQAIIWLVLGGVVAAGFELFKR